MRWRARTPVVLYGAPRLYLWAMAVLIASCSHDPIRYIPETDRTTLETQDRLGGGLGSGGPISVDEMLRRAKSSGSRNAAASRVVIRFDGDTVQPDAAQRDTLRRFAAQVGAGSVTVSSRPGTFDDTGSPALGPRRAIAVSRELSDVVPDVQMRFEAGLPPGIVVVSLGHPVVRNAEPENPQP